jgi:hypothetical protein
MVRLSSRDSPYGDICSSDPEPVIRLLLLAAGLSEIVHHESVHLAVMSDGMNSFHSCAQLSIGIKVVDVQAHHCKTKKALSERSQEHDDDDDHVHFKGVQSSEMSTVCIMADAKDKSNMYAEDLLDFYKYTKCLKKEGIPASEFDPSIAPFIITYPSDLKASEVIAS